MQCHATVLDTTGTSYARQPVRYGTLLLEKRRGKKYIYRGMYYYYNLTLLRFKAHYYIGSFSK